MARWVLLPLLCSLSLIITGAQADVPTLSDALTATADLSTLHDLLTSQYPDLLKKLEASDSKSPITLCAPSNAAFDKIQNSDIVGPALANNDTATVENILNYHVIPGEHTSKTLTSSFQFLRTLLVDPSETGVSGGQRVAAVLQSGDPPEIVFVSGEGTRAVVSQQDIASREGKRLYQRPHERGRLTRPVIRRVIQVIDYFLIPPQPFVDTASRFGLADEAHSVTSFLGAVYSLPDKAIATYLNTTQNVTIFVPDNIAMETVSGALAAMSASTLADLLLPHLHQRRTHLQRQLHQRHHARHPLRPRPPDPLQLQQFLHQLRPRPDLGPPPLQRRHAHHRQRPPTQRHHRLTEPHPRNTGPRPAYHGRHVQQVRGTVHDFRPRLDR